MKVSIDQALRGCGKFRLCDSDGSTVLPTNKTLESGRSRLVFWPLCNEPMEVWQLLTALSAGFVPILLPPKLPSVKQAALNAAYPRFGYRRNGQIEFPKDPATADEGIMLVFLTSGSTGTPRLVAATETALLHGVAGMQQQQGLGEVGSTAIILPMHFAYPFINQLLWAVWAERDCIISASGAWPYVAFRELRESAAAMTCLTAAQVNHFAAFGWGEAQGALKMRVVNVAAGPFPSRHFGCLNRLFPVARILNNYGCTEALTRIACSEVISDNYLPTCAGDVFPGLNIRVTGEESPGPLEFRGPSISPGLVRPDGSLEKFPWWVSSGDMGSIDEANRVHIFGRFDQVFKSCGERHSLAEVEFALESCPGLDCAFAWILNRTEIGDCAGAVVHGKTEPSSSTLQRHLRLWLQMKAWPRCILWANTWPTLSNGKADRVELRRQAESDQYRTIWENPCYEE